MNYLFADTEAGGVEHDLHPGAHPIVIGVTVTAVAPFAAVHQLSPIDLGPPPGPRDQFLEAGAHQNRSPPWTLNLVGGQAKTGGQGRRLAVWMGRRAWSLMEMVLLTRLKDEMIGVTALFLTYSCCLFMDWRLAFFSWTLNFCFLVVLDDYIVGGKIFSCDAAI